MNIAIVGSGIAGLTAAYLLNRAHDVEVFEREDYAGGHAHTVSINTGDHELGLDTGFIVYNEHTYPGFTKLLRELRVTTKAGDMSISIRCRACRMEYSSRGIRGLLAQRGGVAQPQRWRMGLDMLRFYRDARRVLADGSVDQMTLAGYLSSKRYGGEFVRHFIKPLAAAVWSTPPGQVDAFPVRYFLHFLTNHGIIGLQPAFVWRTVEGGSSRYVRAMTETFTRGVRLSTPVRKVWRHGDGVMVRLSDGSCRGFDKVVLACHADEALRLLADASCEEQRALGGFAYSRNHAVLHTDASMLPERLAARASWNHVTDDCRGDGATLGMTYHLNRLQALDEPAAYCVSLNAGDLRPDSVIREMAYDHPTYTFETLAAQKALQSLSGDRHTYFAGAYLGYGFHEDGLQSGALVAASLGVRL